MKRRDFREKTQPLVMIIPMIDIMLFLLVFFMLGTIYMVQTNTLPVSLPQSSTAKQETRPNVVPITVLESGDVLFDKDTVPNQQLGENIHAAIERDKDTIFVLRGDKSARYESVVAVLDLLKKSGAARVSIATELKK
ncbi:MAG: biopolymer transporter ExbD [Selenomonadaceae bacterium]|nr:biopolymer transporter ExbD [Selenomonadaceae bacterium]